MVKLLILLVVFTFTCNGCSTLFTTLVVDECNRENVYCGNNDREEKDFKNEKINEALERDFKNTADFFSNEQDVAVKKDKESPTVPLCDEGTEKVCTAKVGCTCEPVEIQLAFKVHGQP